MIYTPLCKKQQKKSNKVEFLAHLQGFPPLHMTNTNVDLSGS